MPKPKINESDLCRAAKRLRCSTAEVETVAAVESAGEGFYADGFPVILFERHLFRKFTQGKFNASHPHLSGSQGGYGKAGQHQRDKFNEAFALNPTAAMKACSWGKFQILGSNYEVCGFESVGAFVEAMKESEGRQLDAFCEFVISNGLGDELREHDWAGFARRYNGPAYKKNKYDTKLATAYEKFKKRTIHCNGLNSAQVSQLPSTIVSELQDDGKPSDTPVPDFTGGAAIVQDNPSPSVDPITETKTTEVTQIAGVTTAVEQSQTVPAGDAPEVKPTQVSTNGPLAKWLFSSGALTTVGAAVWAWVTTNASIIAIALICLTVLIFSLIFRGAITDMIRMQAAADPDKKNVT